MIYKASQNGCCPETFHKLCDAKGPTVTILYGKGNIAFGGYTSQSWISGHNKVTISDDRAFLFFQEDYKNAVLKLFETQNENSTWAITCDKNFGPTFGGGTFLSYAFGVETFRSYDLQTFKDVEIKSTDDGYFILNGTINFNTHYHNSSVVKGQNMVSDIEVLQVKGKSVISIFQTFV